MRAETTWYLSLIVALSRLHDPVKVVVGHGQTRHKLDPDTPLSESATKVKEDFLSENDGFRFTSLYSIETPEGEFLGLGFEKGQWDYESFTLWESTILFTPIR